MRVDVGTNVNFFEQEKIAKFKFVFSFIIIL